MLEGTFTDNIRTIEYILINVAAFKRGYLIECCIELKSIYLKRGVWKMLLLPRALVVLNKDIDKVCRFVY